jgi:hypothetical protein
MKRQTCSASLVGSDLVLSVTDGQRGDSVLLDADVE